MTHLDTPPEPRSVEILDRIKSVFAAKGFDGASMQDLARAAGMSAGNFYRYFPSKNAIIEALVARDMQRVEGEFARVMQSSDPRAALRDVIRRRLETVEYGETALWAEIDAASSRREEIAAISGAMEREIIGYLIRVFARIADMPEAEARARFTAHASLVILLLKGVSVQACGTASRLADPPSPELQALVLRTIDTLLSEVAGTPRTRHSA